MLCKRKMTQNNKQKQTNHMTTAVTIVELDNFVKVSSCVN